LYCAFVASFFQVEVAEIGEFGGAPVGKVDEGTTETRRDQNENECARQKAGKNASSLSLRLNCKAEQRSQKRPRPVRHVADPHCAGRRQNTANEKPNDKQGCSSVIECPG